MKCNDLIEDKSIQLLHMLTLVERDEDELNKQQNGSDEIIKLAVRIQANEKKKKKRVYL